MLLLLCLLPFLLLPLLFLSAKLTNSGNGNPEFSNMPRKFNVCFVGSKEM